MKPVIAISIEHYESLLKRATEDSPLYFRLKNAVKMANTVVILCDPEQAEMLLQVAKNFCPDAVPQIQRAIRFSWGSKGNDYDRGEKAAQTTARRRPAEASNWRATDQRATSRRTAAEESSKREDLWLVNPKESVGPFFSKNVVLRYDRVTIDLWAVRFALR
jgi:hypothetical protein